MLFQFNAIIDVGITREVQQDSILAIPQIFHDNDALTDDHYFDDSNAALFVVADGMGGGVHGELASKIAIESIEQFVLANKSMIKNDIYSFVNEAIYAANKGILEYISENAESKGMGSTVVLGLIFDGILHLGWVGDSRCYGISNLGIIQLTHDHSLVQSMVDDGLISEEEAFEHPNRNIINQSLGMPNVVPSFERKVLHHIERLIFCSDGLNSMLKDNQILEFSNQHLSIEETVKNLVDAANIAGGHDNISCIGVQLMKPSLQVAAGQLSDIKMTDNPKPKSTRLWKISLILFMIGSIWWFINRSFHSDPPPLMSEKNENKDAFSQGQIEDGKKDDLFQSSMTDGARDTVFTVKNDEKAELIQPSESYNTAEGNYTIRLKVFMDSIKAASFVEKNESIVGAYSWKVNRLPTGNFEVILSGFKNKSHANDFMSQGTFPDAIIIYNHDKQ